MKVHYRGAIVHCKGNMVTNVEALSLSLLKLDQLYTQYLKNTSRLKLAESVGANGAQVVPRYPFGTYKYQKYAYRYPF